MRYIVLKYSAVDATPNTYIFIADFPLVESPDGCAQHHKCANNQSDGGTLQQTTQRRGPSWGRAQHLNTFTTLSGLNERFATVCKMQSQIK